MGAVAAPERTRWTGPHGSHQRRHQLIVVAERRPQPGGYLVHDSAQAGAGSARSAAVTRVLLEADDEGPHAPTI